MTKVRALLIFASYGQRATILENNISSVSISETKLMYAPL